MTEADGERRPRRRSLELDAMVRERRGEDAREDDAAAREDGSARAKDGRDASTADDASVDALVQGVSALRVESKETKEKTDETTTTTTTTTTRERAPGRAKTDVSTARRMIASALGVDLREKDSERDEAEKRARREARLKKAENARMAREAAKKEIEN